MTESDNAEAAPIRRDILAKKLVLGSVDGVEEITPLGQAAAQQETW